MTNDDRGHSAMPKLYGAPAYARPPVVAAGSTPRPFDPDDLPLESQRAAGEEATAGDLVGRPYASQEAGPAAPPADRVPAGAAAAGQPPSNGAAALRGRPFLLRLLGERRQRPAGRDPVGE